MKKLLSMLLVVALLLGSVSTVSAKGYSDMREAIGTSIANFSARIIHTQNFLDRSIIENFDLTVFYYWESWCQPCINAMPYFQALYDYYNSTSELDVNVIGIFGGSYTEESAVSFLNSNGYTWTNVIPDNVLDAVLDTCGYIPQTLIVDRYGIVRDHIVGGFSTYNRLYDCVEMWLDLFQNHDGEYCTVTYQNDINGEIIRQDTVPIGSVLPEKPIVPEIVGATFEGWIYDDNIFERRCNSTTYTAYIVMGNTIVTAHYTVDGIVHQSWDFETDPASEGFDIIDSDGDGYTWEWNYNTSFSTHSGSGLVSSASYVNGIGALSPDNWLITPSFVSTDMLRFYMCAQDPSYPFEYVGVYVRVNDSDEWSEEIAGFTATAEYERHTIDLSEYEGQRISVAFRHYNTIDMYRLKIDDIELIISDGFNCIVDTPYKRSPDGDDHSGLFHVEYDDAWFTAPSNEFNYKLAKASLAGAAGSFSLDSDPNDVYVKKTLTKFGFRNIYTHKFDDNTVEANSCGYAFGYKELTNGDYLVCAAIRSSGYGSEWESNFNVMPDNNSYLYSLGFKEAADDVYSHNDPSYKDLNTYINELCSEHNVNRSRIRVWTFGFSRGGAVANLLAARLNQESNIPQSQIYAYTFATPKTVIRSAQIKYDNIFNILQETDAVPHVPLRTWDYTWYGTTYYLPSRTLTGRSYADKLGSMETCFDHLMFESGRPNVHYVLGNAQELSIDLLLDYLDDVIRTRNIYRDDGWQEVLRSAGMAMGHAGDFDLATLLNILLPGSEEIVNHICTLLLSWRLLGPLEKASELVSLASDLIDQAEYYIISGGNTPAAKTCKMLGNLIFHYCVRFWENEIPFGDGTYLDRYNEMFELLADACSNGFSGELFMQHWPETYMAWLDSAEDESLFERSSYKRISLKCPIDVYVYDSNNVLVGRIVDDVVDDSLTESIYCACDMLGEKTVYLPDDDTYRIEIVAREDCEIDLVNEYYTEEMELVAVECYIEVPMDEEQSFEADYQREEQSCMLISDGTEIQADFVIEDGDEIPEFTVELNKEGFGTVAGDGYYTLGETVTLCALEMNGSTFAGWYDEQGNLISTENTYSYSITENGAYTGVFEGGVLPGDVNCDGTTDVTDALLTLRASMGLIVLSDQQTQAADVNGDGEINMVDALMVLRMAMGLI